MVPSGSSVPSVEQKSGYGAERRCYSQEKLVMVSYDFLAPVDDG
jgi:hypothetical protein